MEARLSRRLARVLHVVVSATVGVLNFATFYSELPLALKVGLFGATAVVYVAVSVLVARLHREPDPTADSEPVIPPQPAGGPPPGSGTSASGRPTRRLTTALRLDISVAVGLVVGLCSGTTVAVLCRWSQWSGPLVMAAMAGAMYLIICSVKCPVCGTVASDDGTVRASRWHRGPANFMNHKCLACGALFTEV